MGLISHFAKPPCLFGLVIDVNGAEKNFTFGMAVNPTAKNSFSMRAAAGSSEGLIARTPTPLSSEEARSEAARQLDVCA